MPASQLTCTRWHPFPWNTLSPSFPASLARAIVHQRRSKGYIQMDKIKEEWCFCFGGHWGIIFYYLCLSLSLSPFFPFSFPFPTQSVPGPSPLITRALCSTVLFHILKRLNTHMDWNQGRRTGRRREGSEQEKRWREGREKDKESERASDVM